MEGEIKIISARKIYEILNLIRRKPYLFLTSKSITALQNFLNGYQLLGYADDIYHSGEPDIHNFASLILSRDKESRGVGNPYTNVLLKECKGNEEAAFDNFFELLDQFLKEHMNIT
jgi:hypothetical protein